MNKILAVTTDNGDNYYMEADIQTLFRIVSHLKWCLPSLSSFQFTTDLDLVIKTNFFFQDGLRGKETGIKSSQEKHSVLVLKC